MKNRKENTNGEGGKGTEGNGGGERRWGKGTEGGRGERRGRRKAERAVVAPLLFLCSGHMSHLPHHIHSTVHS